MYFKALLPSCALSLEALSLMDSLNHSPSACSICLQHGDPAMATGSLCRTVLFVVLPFLHNVQACLGKKKIKKGS